MSEWNALGQILRNFDNKRTNIEEIQKFTLKKLDEILKFLQKNVSNKSD